MRIDIITVLAILILTCIVLLNGGSVLAFLEWVNS